MICLVFEAARFPVIGYRGHRERWRVVTRMLSVDSEPETCVFSKGRHFTIRVLFISGSSVTLPLSLPRRTLSLSSGVNQQILAPAFWGIDV